MTEDVMETMDSPPVVTNDAKVSELNSGGEIFRKPVSLKKSNKQSKLSESSSKNKDVTHSELKKKKKQLTKRESSTSSKGETEDATESVDSGCIADIAADVTDWPQVEAAVLEERNYVLSLLSWLPDFQWVVPDLKKLKAASDGEESSTAKDENEDDGKTSNKKKKGDPAGTSEDNNKSSKKKRVDPLGTAAKLRKFLNEADEIDNLRDRYTEKLKEFKQGKRNKKKEGKLQKKLKNLNRRNKKNSNRQRKLEQAQIFEHKHKALEQSKRQLHKIKVYNEKGKMVFSKFDFSNDGSDTQSRKAKNLEQKVEKAIKEREMRRKLLMDGNHKAAAELKDKRAWSSALQRAEGVKVRDDLDMLQKSLKKKEHRKMMSKKRWEERTNVLEKKMKEKQTKRQDNLKSRRDAKLQKKGKKLKMKGHIVPGF